MNAARLYAALTLSASLREARFDPSGRAAAVSLAQVVNVARHSPCTVVRRPHADPVEQREHRHVGRWPAADHRRRENEVLVQPAARVGPRPRERRRDRCTRCGSAFSLPLAFIRSAGTIHIAASRSNSLHTAPKASLVRAAVSTANSRQRAAVPCCATQPRHELRRLAVRQRSRPLSPGFARGLAQLAAHAGGGIARTACGRSRPRTPRPAAAGCGARSRPRAAGVRLRARSCGANASAFSSSGGSMSSIGLFHSAAGMWFSRLAIHCAACFVVRGLDHARVVVARAASQRPLLALLLGLPGFCTCRSASRRVRGRRSDRSPGEQLSGLVRGRVAPISGSRPPAACFAEPGAPSPISRRLAPSAA